MVKKVALLAGPPDGRPRPAAAPARPTSASAAASVGANGAAGDTLTPSRRVLMVLQAFAETGEWGVRELSVKLGLSKSSVHRTMQEMAQEGLLRATEESRYSIAPALLRIGAMLSVTSDLLRVARPHAFALRDATRETIFVNAYDRDRRRYISIIGAESPRPVRLSYQPSQEQWADVQIASSGKAIMAFIPEVEINAIVAADPRLSTPAKRKALLAELATIRKRGWAHSHGERREGAFAVAAPIYDAGLQVVADMVIGWPMRGEDIDVNELGRMCKLAADAVSADLGAAQYALPRWDM
jgi:DNA-binding IclR family transcriptional regulator